MNAAATHLNIIKNGLLGTEKSCTRFTNNIDCNRLPLNLSDWLSKTMEYINCLQPSVTAIINVAYVQIGLIVGLVLIILFA